jgi:hypothetical protein
MRRDCACPLAAVIAVWLLARNAHPFGLTRGTAMSKRSYTLQALAAALLTAICILVRSAPAECQGINLEGVWSGGGTVTFASGDRERAHCRAHYRRRSNEAYVVTTVCATASARAEQTATLRKIGENKYRGSFYNSEYGVSGTVYVTVRGNRQSVRLTSSAGWASFTFTR